MKIHLIHHDNQISFCRDEFYALRRKMDALYYDPLTSADAAELEEEVMGSVQASDHMLWGILERDGYYFGYFRYVTMPDGMANTLFLFAPQEEAGEELVNKVWEMVTWRMKTKAHRELVWRSRQEFWIPFKEKLGGRRSNSGFSFRLNLSDVNRNQLEQWIREGEDVSKGFSVLEQDYLEEKYIEEMAGLTNQLVQDMPREDGDLVLRSSAEIIRTLQQQGRNAGMKQLQLVLFDPQNKIAGTTLIRYKHEHMEIDQRITGVHRNYRRRGLAKYLKALMMKKILEQFPDCPSVRTECFAMNLPMIALNKAMGYRIAAREADHVFQNLM
ncbi:MAG: GNAT family N-acetyltransferase [Bacteroidia bacterium]|nr:GNAT family N-acetyltransferase [Bacteroidia bacterium]